MLIANNEGRKDDIKMRVSPIVNFRQYNLDKCCKPRKMQEGASEVPTGRLDDGKFLAPKSVSFGAIFPIIRGRRNVKEVMVRRDPKYHKADMKLYRALRDSDLCHVKDTYGSFLGNINYSCLNEEYAKKAKEAAEEFRAENEFGKDWYIFLQGKNRDKLLRKYGELAKRLQHYYDQYEKDLEGPHTALEALGEYDNGPMFWNY